MKSSFVKKPLFTKAVLRTDEALVPIDVHEPEQLSPISKGSKAKTIEDDDIEDVDLDLDGNSENLKTYNDPAPKTSAKSFKQPLKLSVPAKKAAPASIQKTVEKSTERDHEEEPTPAAAKKKVNTKEKSKATETEVSTSKTVETQKKAPKGRGNKAKDEDQEVDKSATKEEDDEENSVKKGNRKIRVLVNKKAKPDEVKEEKEIEKPKEVAATTPKMGKFKVPTALNKSPVNLKENKKEVAKKDDKNKKPVKTSEKAKPSEEISKKKNSTSKPKEDKKQAKDEKKAKKKVNTKKKAKEEEEEEAADDEESDNMGESDLSKLMDDEEEDGVFDDDEENDNYLYPRDYRNDDDGGSEADENDSQEDGIIEITTSKEARKSAKDGNNSYWKNNVRKSAGSSARRRKADQMLNPHLYDSDRKLKLAKLSKKVIMFSGLEQDDVDFVYQVAQKLGEFQVENGTGAVMTHLLYSGNKRTMKLLYAIAKRAWILDISYLYESFEFGGWLAEKEYESAGAPAKKLRDAYGPLFKDTRFYFNGGTDDNFPSINLGELKVLVKLAGAKVAEKPEESDVIVEDELNKKFSLKFKKFEGSRPHVISYKWIFDSLMKYSKLNYQDYEVKI